MHGRALAVLLIGSAITLDLSWSIVQVQASPRSRGETTFVAATPPPHKAGCRTTPLRTRLPGPARTRTHVSGVPAPRPAPGLTEAECAAKRALRRADRTPAAHR